MRIWLKPDRMAALNINPSQIREVARGQQLPLRGRPHQRLAGAGQPHGATPTCAPWRSFRNLVVRQSGDNLVRLRDVADVVLGAEDYDSEVRFTGERAVFMGVWPLPNANSLDVIKRVRAEMALIQKELPTGLNGRIAYDATKYIEDAIHEVIKTLSETLLIVAIVIFLFLGSLRSVLVPLVAIPISLIGAIFLMQVFGFTLNLLTLAGHRAVGRPGGGRCHRHRGKRGAPRPRGPVAPARRLAGRARTGQPGHRDDDHAGGGLCAHRPAGRAHRFAVPRVRLHAGRRGVHLRRRRADAVARSCPPSCWTPDARSTG